MSEPELPAPVVPPSTVPRRGRHWDSYSAVVASLVGLLALSVSGYTAYLQRQQVRAQVWPYLSLARWSGHRLVASNSGMGPARVTAVKVAVDGRPMRDWAQVLSTIVPDGPRVTTSTLNNRVLPPNERIDWMALPNDEEGRKAFAALMAQDRFKVGMMVCYCSVLNDCWITYMGSDKAMEIPDHDHDEPIDRCPIREAERFHD